jgi:hypothetical protein
VFACRCTGITRWGRASQHRSHHPTQTRSVVCIPLTRVLASQMHQNRCSRLALCNFCCWDDLSGLEEQDCLLSRPRPSRRETVLKRLWFYNTGTAAPATSHRRLAGQATPRGTAQVLSNRLLLQGVMTHVCVWYRPTHEGRAAGCKVELVCGRGGGAAGGGRARKEEKRGETA